MVDSSVRESTIFRVGLLGHGTVGGALHQLIEQRGGAVEATTGMRPAVSGVLTRSRGDFPEIVAGSDLIVELIGGLEPARTYILEAMRAGKHVVTADKQGLGEHGEGVYDAARAAGGPLPLQGAGGGGVAGLRRVHEA